MSHCFLKEALSVLKESSRSAVVDGAKGTFDEAKRYLHLERPVEEELRKALKAAAAEPGPQLVLLCGNVGDGKSHLIAQLRETDPELLQHFAIHNDATESSRWDATNIDELRRVLAPYADSELNGGGTKKTLIAINLGTLSNFILDEGEKSFCRLRDYVKQMKILEEGEVGDNRFNESSPFQFVSFCDQGLFEITPEGPVSDLIEGALAKVVAPSEANPFYAAFCKDCGPTATKCPIRSNLMLLQIEDVRQRLSALLIECIVKHHQIVSIRALYNLIHDILVPPELDVLGNDEVCEKLARMKAESLLSCSLINAPFEHPDASIILRHLHYLDPALSRTDMVDEKIISLMISESPKDFLLELQPPESVLNAFANPQLPTDLQVSTFVRCHYFLGEDKKCFVDTVYADFMRLVYSWHTGDNEAIKHAYRLIGNATLSWHGIGGKGEMLVKLGNPQLDYRLSQRVELKPVVKKPPQLQGERLSRFSLCLPFCFDLGSESGGTETFLVDYRLYEMAERVVQGYRPNHADHSSFITFSTFVERVAESGEMNRSLHVTEIAAGKDFVLELDEFEEFCFEEGEI